MNRTRVSRFSKMIKRKDTYYCLDCVFSDLKHSRFYESITAKNGTLKKFKAL